MCRSQQVSEVTEELKKSEEECDLIRENFGSYNDFEVMPIQTHQPENERITDTIRS